jgi:type I restriction enzyme S subunit
MTENEPKTIFQPQVPIVPEGWSVLPFQKAASIVSDQGKRVKQSKYLETGKIPVIDQGQDYIGGYIDDEAMAYDGELPVILFGDHTRSIKYVDKRFAVGAEGIKILKPVESYEPKFFFYLMHSLQIPSRGYSRHFQFLKKFHLPIAPPHDQKLIVSEIEKQFSRLDEAVAGLKRIKANLKRYKAAVLKAAVEGKLTEDWRLKQKEEGKQIETGAQLLKRILAERKKKWEEKNPAKKYKEPAAPDTSNLPELPKGWVWATIDQVAECLDSMRVPVNKKERASRQGIVPYYGANGQVGWIDDYIYNETLVLVVEDETFTGRQLPFSYKISGKSWVNNHAHVLRNTKAVQIDYLNYSLAYYPFTPLTTGTTGRKKLTQAALLSAPYQLPPIAEQIEIINQVESCLSVAEEIEATIETNLKRAERLQQLILRKAFSGRLHNN